LYEEYLKNFGYISDRRIMDFVMLEGEIVLQRMVIRIVGEEWV